MTDANPLSGPADDHLMAIADIRAFFGLGRTAAYELTHRPDFPDPLEISVHCYRWWASEVHAFAATLRRTRAEDHRPRAQQRTRADPDAPHRITGKARAIRSRGKAS